MEFGFVYCGGTQCDAVGRSATRYGAVQCGTTLRLAHRCLLGRLGHRVVASGMGVDVDLAKVEDNATLGPVATKRVAVGVDQPRDVQGLALVG